MITAKRCCWRKLISREQAIDNRRSRDAAERALALAESDAERAAALAARGKCEKRLGDIDGAKASLALALLLDPHNKDACKRLAAIALERGQTDNLLKLTDDLLTQGTGHARLFGARVLAYAQAGDIATAHRIDGFKTVASERTITSASGLDIEQFNAALAEELLAHPGMRYERYGSASEYLDLAGGKSRATRYAAFQGAYIRDYRKAWTHIAAVSSSGHPWAEAQPDSAFLRNWCVITESTGFETWHVHQFGWLSGVYYVQVPELIANGTNRDGCLAFG